MIQADGWKKTMDNSIRRGASMVGTLHVLLLIYTFVLCGCANTAAAHFETDATAIRTGKTPATDAGRATVFMMHQSALGQGFLPPLFYAVDERMVATMPIGAYVPLSMEPGGHTFTRFRVVPGGFFLSRFQVARADVKLDLIAGKTYFVSEVGAFVDTFRQIDEKRGREILEHTELAKFIHSPMTTQEFVSRQFEAERLRKEASIAPAAAAPTSAPQKYDTAGFADLLPSSKQVGEALEAVGTLALVALYVLALGAGGSANTYQSTAPATFAPPPSLSRPASPVVASPTGGGFANRSNESATRTMTNPSTGVKYVFDGDRVNGSDGSRFRVVGTTLFSDTGQTYQVVGEKFVYASDGRSCTVISDKLYCK